MLSVEEKKVHMLLKSVIFHYHGLDDQEKKDLDNTANLLDAHDEYQWAMNFVATDYITAFDRARVFLNDIIGDYQKEKRIELINEKIQNMRIDMSIRSLPGKGTTTIFTLENWLA